MQLNRQQSPKTGPSQSQNIEQYLNELVNKYRPRMKQQSIALETDFDNVDACVDPSLLHSAASALVENAIEAMPDGGEISITLIDGQHQFELEVADTLGMAYNSFERESQNSKNQLPVILPFPETEKLRDAHRAALQQGGQIQTWSCPQGGTAHVLVIPRRLRSNANRSSSNPDRRPPGNHDDD